jgi:hypothetical protein
LRAQHSVKHTNHPAYRLNGFEQVTPGEFPHGASMYSRGDEQVSVIVGKPIQNNQ